MNLGVTTIPELIKRGAAVHGERLALLSPSGETLSYAALQVRVWALCSQLREAGVGPEDRVAIVMPNGIGAAVAFLGAASCGAAAPLNPAYKDNEFEFYFTDLRAKALVTDASASGARRVAEALGIAVIDKPGEGDIARWTRVEEDATATALLLHTSGTTARPKLVPLSQANLCASAENIARTLLLTREDRCLNVMPLFHIHGLAAALLASLSAGGSVICTQGYRPGGSFFAWMREWRPSWYTAVPTMHQAIVGEAGAFEEAIRECPLRFVRSSSAALAPTVAQRLEDVFGAPAIEAYGMTEASHQMASNPLPPGMRKVGSVGTAAGPEVALMNDDGKFVGEGEVVIRGASVTLGYAENPEANAKAFTTGWFRTGDQGRMDDDGYLYLTARIKELINRGGEKVSPREIDEALLEHPGVAQAVAFAMPHPTLGEEIGAAVVLCAGKKISTADLRQFAGARLAAFKVPRRIVIVEEIPKGPTGKVQRIGLAEKLELGSGFVAPRTELERDLAGMWAEVLGIEEIGVEDDFYSLGGDSLLAATLLARVEEVFPEAALLETLEGAGTVSEMALRLG